jgi:uncharacterized protein
MAAPAAAAWRITAEGLSLLVRLTPRGGRDALEGAEMLADGRLAIRARVRAAPTGGEANDALRVLLGKALDVPRSRVRIASGAASRTKTVVIEGDGAGLADALARAIAN